MNKVNSKAVLRFNVAETQAFAPIVKERILERLAGRLTLAGELIVASDKFRDQGRNREDCLEKLHTLLMEAARPPVHRKETKPTRSSKRRTRAAKQMNSEKKRLRRTRDFD